MTGPPADMTETPDPGKKSGMDALSDVLRVTHLTGGVFLHAQFFAPWCIAARIPAEHCAPALGPASHLIIYHYVVEGDGYEPTGEAAMAAFAKSCRRGR